MPMPNRTFSLSSGSYRFGFNGKEKINEVYGDGNLIDYDARMGDVRLGRLFSLDPLSKKFAGESNYSFAGNSPIIFVDKEGKEKTVYLTIINVDGKKTQLTLVDKYFVRGKIVEGYYSPSIHSYDVSQNVIIDLKNNTKTEGTEQLKYKSDGLKAVGEIITSTASEMDILTDGVGDKQEGGFRLVSVNGENVGAYPTKMKASNLKELQSINFYDVADILSAGGAKGKSLSSSSGMDAVALMLLMI